MKDLFISYRRNDAAAITQLLYDRLSGKFDGERIFFDISAIAAGRNFRLAIRQAISQSKVVLVVIGDDWLILTKGGLRRIDDPDDWVHIEVAAALARGVPVIPVLVEGQPMPTPQDLPDPLRELSHRQCLEVREGRDFDSDVRRLGAELESYLETRIEEESRQKVATISRELEEQKQSVSLHAALAATLLVAATGILVGAAFSQELRGLLIGFGVFAVALFALPLRQILLRRDRITLLKRLRSDFAFLIEKPDETLFERSQQLLRNYHGVLNDA